MMQIAPNKVAFLFHGIVGGMGGRNGVGEPIDIETCAKIIKYQHRQYDADYFVHSWSVKQSDRILASYSPKLYIFEPQEYFGYQLDSNQLADQDQTDELRNISRHVSMRRVVDLKNKFELQHGFRYQWVVLLRLDLVLLNGFRFSELDPSIFYIPYEPHWPNAINDTRLQMIHDVFFFSSSENADKYATVTEDILSGKFQQELKLPHVIAFKKVNEAFPNRVQYGARRYEDFEIYRMAVDPSQNVLGHQYGALQVRGKIEELLRRIG
jgi:hypothetical protein